MKLYSKLYAYGKHAMMICPPPKENLELNLNRLLVSPWSINAWPWSHPQTQGRPVKFEGHVPDFWNGPLNIKIEVCVKIELWLNYAFVFISIKQHIQSSSSLNQSSRLLSIVVELLKHCIIIHKVKYFFIK